MEIPIQSNQIQSSARLLGLSFKKKKKRREKQKTRATASMAIQRRHKKRWWRGKKWAGPTGEGAWLGGGSQRRAGPRRSRRPGAVVAVPKLHNKSHSKTR